MEENRGFRYRSLFWPIILIGVGVVWFLANLGLIPMPSLRLLLRMWPLILIVIGLDIIFGRRSPLFGGLIGLGAVALVIALLIWAPSLGIQPSSELKTLHFNEPLESATSARIDLDLERYPTTVEALSASTNLIEAELDTVTDVEFSARGDQTKTVTLNPVDNFGFDIDWLDIVDADWEIGLSPEVPLGLTVDVGSGSATLDIKDLELTDLQIDGGSGSVRLNLPASASQYPLEISGGSGSFNIELETGANIESSINVGSGSFDIRIGSGSDFDARIDGGSGSLSVDVPNDVGVRIVVRSKGSGSVNVPNSYQLVDDQGDDDRDTGIWESEGFSTAAHRVEINFEPGSGSFTVR